MGHWVNQSFHRRLYSQGISTKHRSVMISIQLNLQIWLITMCRGLCNSITSNTMQSATKPKVNTVMAGIITGYTLFVNYRLLPSRLIIWLSHYRSRLWKLTNQRERALVFPQRPADHRNDSKWVMKRFLFTAVFRVRLQRSAYMLVIKSLFIHKSNGAQLAPLQ